MSGFNFGTPTTKPSGGGLFGGGASSGTGSSGFSFGAAAAAPAGKWNYFQV